MAVIAVDDHHAGWRSVLDDRDAVTTTGGWRIAARHRQRRRGGEKTGRAISRCLAAVTEPEAYGSAGQPLFFAETPGGCQEQEVGIRFDEKYCRFPAELKFFEGDEVVEDVPELFLQLGRLERDFQDIVYDFLMFERVLGQRKCRCVVSPAFHMPQMNVVATTRRNRGIRRQRFFGNAAGRASVGGREAYLR